MRAFSSRRLVLASFALAITMAGCASGGGGGGGRSGGGGGPSRLTNEALQAVVQLDAYQAIQRLRARWLQRRAGSTASVFVDGAERQGGLEQLRGIPVADVDEMRYLSANEATTRFGTGHMGGAILITTKR